ncbi:unnamed protein product [Chironomus riparius]|uniref:Peptidase S1 domain-containing protein n=1 Tax=Chironomus riparius TaxID=315576 RepID=A0A9N9S2N5_9DIPT|nr:unnamed protein product [Chironomus riparius]
MGVHDIEKKFEPNRVVMKSNEFFIHPDWNPLNKNYDSDIAIIKTSHQIQFTEFIQPICLWELYHNIPATSGIVVGYGINGQSTHNKERIAKKLQIFIHQNEECIAAETKLSVLASNRTFCGESVYGNSICFGDSGHGFFVKVKNKFYLRGIISASPKFANNSCTFTNYGIYTNVLKYKSWIDNPENCYRNYNTCGIMNSAVSLIQGGNFSLHDQFPWTALIKYSSLYYTGVLISQKHVLTYSGSVSFWNDIEKKYIPQHLNTFIVHFGMVDANGQDDPNVITVNPAKIILHPSLQKVGKTVVNAIGIIVLETSVPYNKFIKPICLWNNQNYFNKDLKIYAFGYGKDETGKHSKVRKYSRMMHTSNEVCKEVYADRSSAFESSKLFCAQDLSSRGKLKFGDPCETTQQCSFVGSVCLNRECVCEPFLEATNHFDKCGKPVSVNESCFFNEQCETSIPQTECRDGRCICRFDKMPILKKDGSIECMGK